MNSYFNSKRKFAVLFILIQPVFPGAVFAADVCFDARCRSASEIIGDCQKFEDDAAQFHQSAEILIAQATKLKGQAQILQTKVPNLPLQGKMSASEFATGSKQYETDLADFRNHTIAYQGHLKQFQSTIGECHAHATALDSVLKKYEIHVGEFHINTADIKPPHICGILQATVNRDFTSVANQMVADQMRVLRAEAQLQSQEVDLRNAEQAGPAQSMKVMDRVKREEKEQALAGEFNRLQIEYELVKSEKDRLASANPKGVVGKVTHSSVSGKISH